MPYFTEEEIDLIVSHIVETEEPELFDLVPVYPGSTIYEAREAGKEDR